MKIDVALRIRDRFVDQVKSMKWEARNGFWSHDKIVDRLTNSIYSQDDYQKIPEYMRQYTRGYIFSWLDALWHEMVPVYMDLATTTLHIGKDNYPAKAQWVTYAGCVWSHGNHELRPEWYSKKSADEIADEMKKRGVVR